MCSNSKPVSGFTLLELIVAISIAGILVTIAIPSFSTLIRNNRLTTYANELVTSLNLARSEAIKRGASVSVRKIGGAGTYWSTSGWLVFVDTNDNGVLDTGEEILRTYDKLPDTFTLVGNIAGTGNSDFVNFVRFQADGTISINSGKGSFAICDNSDSNNIPEPYTSRLIIVNMMGKIQMGLDRYDKDGNLKPDGIPEKEDNKNLTSCTSP